MDCSYKPLEWVNYAMLEFVKVKPNSLPFIAGAAAFDLRYLYFNFVIITRYLRLLNALRIILLAIS